MKKHNPLLVLILLLICNTLASGQYVLSEFKSQATYKGELLVRWEPKTLEEWETSIKEGYQVKVFSGSDFNNLSLTNTETIRVATKEAWDQAINTQTDSIFQQYYAGSKGLIYPFKEVEEGLMNSLEPEEGKTKAQTAAEFRMGFLVQNITIDLNLIKMAGLGYAHPMEQGKFYRIEVSTGNFEPHFFKHDPAQRTLPSLPSLLSEFADKKVTLKWKTADFEDQYFGYTLSGSKDGRQFEKVNQLPYVNMLETSEENPETQWLTEEMELEKNYKNYWFRIKGMNYFGIETILYAETKGYGYEVIKVMPIINHADQTEDNEAEIDWIMDKKFNRLIDHFAIMRADEIDGPYKTVLDSLPVSQRSVLLPIKHSRNFYSVAMFPKDGEMVRSFSVFVMGQDTLPPAIPQNVVGIIDSLGIVNLSWEANQEKDLWGYKVFRSEYAEDEFACMTNSPIQDTVFRDTVNLHSLNRNMFYSVIALDKRNNRSDFSPVITLQRPDTIPPKPAMVRKGEFLEDSIQVQWTASTSKDVVKYQLFRREQNEKGWKLLQEFKQAEQTNYYTDKNFELDKNYYYTLVVTDQSNLQSDPSDPYLVQTISNRPKEAFVNFDINYDDNKSISEISWNLSEENELEEIIVFRGPSEKEISMYKIIAPNANSLTQEVGKDEKWYFVFKPIFVDGAPSMMSDIIAVEKPE